MFLHVAGENYVQCKHVTRYAGTLLKIKTVGGEYFVDMYYINVLEAKPLAIGAI